MTKRRSERRPCPMCGRAVEGGRHRVYCTKECTREGQAQRKNGKRITKPCAFCGDAIVARETTRRTACMKDACRKKRLRARCHETYERKKGEAAVRASRLVAVARARAAQHGWPFDITQADIKARIQRGVCEVTGLAFDMGNRADRRTHVAPFAPSIDREDSSKGYTTDNIRVVAWIYNIAKGPYRHADVLTLAKALVSKEA